MQVRPIVGMCVVVAAVLLAGCKQEPVIQIKGGAGTEPVQVIKSASGSDAAFKAAGSTLINEETPAYKDAIAGLAPDYATQSVVVISVGEEPTGGHDVKVTSVSRKGNDLFVSVTITTPGPVAAQVISYPYTAIVIPKFEGVVHVDSTVVNP